MTQDESKDPLEENKKEEDEKKEEEEKKEGFFKEIKKVRIFQSS